MYDLQDARLSRRKTIALQLNAWGVTCGVLIPVVIFVYQVFHWGTTLKWPPFPVRWLFDACGIGLDAVYKQADWTLLGWMARVFLDLPLGVVSLVAVIFSASLISRLIDPDRPQTTAMG